MSLEVRLRRAHPKQAEFINSDAPRKIIRAGRRGGKTTGVAILGLKAFLAGRRVLYATPTQEQIDRFWEECRRALQEPIEAKVLYKNETRHIIELPGTEQRIRAKTAWDADTLRGDYADLLILDEYQLMSPDAWSLVGAPMLLDNNGDAVFIYTTKRGKHHSKELFKKAEKDESGRWATFVFKSHDNPHLSREALDEVAEDMTGLAYRMEILAEEIDDDPRALWKREDIRRVPDWPADMSRIVVGVDPPGTEDGAECGIVVAGSTRLNGEMHAYVLADYSLRGSPIKWGRTAVAAYETHDADRIIGEVNNGGDMVEHTIRTVEGGRAASFKAVRASRGKAIRAEPIAALYERGLVHHVGEFGELEDQMCIAAGSLVATHRGEQPIESVAIGDVVKTRTGWGLVQWARQTNPAASVLCLRTAQGRQLYLTDNHPVYIPAQGFIQAWNLEAGMRLDTIQWPTSRLQNINTANRSYGMGSDGSWTGKAITSIARTSCSIARFGKHIMAQFQAGISSTTSTAIRAIMMLRIWNYSLAASTPSSIPTGLRYGIPHDDQRRRSGTGWLSSPAKSNALAAERYSRASECEPCSATDSADEDIIESIEAIDAKMPVYNLAVLGAPEFYGNGILVHNCNWVPGDKSPDRIDALVWALTELMLKKRGTYMASLRD